MTSLLVALLELSCTGDRAAAERNEHLTATPFGVSGSDLRWVETQQLFAASGLRDEAFGAALALSDGTAIIGAPDAVGLEGAAYVFVESGGRWSWLQRLVDNDAGPLAHLGSSVAISGDTAIVGAPGDGDAVSNPGSAMVYVREGGRWIEQQKLADDDPVGPGYFGYSVAIDGDVAVIGRIDEFEPVHVFERAGTSWTERARLLSDPDMVLSSFDPAPRAVAVSGTTIAVGTPLENDGTGVVYVYGRANGEWALEARLTPPEKIEPGWFGFAVALSGDQLVVGRPGGRGMTEKESGVGEVYLFQRAAGTWGPPIQFVWDEGREGDLFGSRVDVEGDTIIVGTTHSGRYAAHTFTQRAGNWIHQTLAPSDGRFRFGISVGVDRRTALVGTDGSTFEDVEGAVYVQRLLSVNGSACTSGDQCGSEVCVATGTMAPQGICCDRACGPCGTCDTGECRERPPESAGSPPCEPYVCSGSSAECPKACISDLDCIRTHYCSQGTCISKQPIPTPCEMDNQCSSGHCGAQGVCLGTLPIKTPCGEDVECVTGYCVDGVCCDSACTGQCEACDVSGAIGTCSPVDGAPHGERPACLGAGTFCGGSCNGEEVIACEYRSPGTECGSECVDEIVTRNACDGRGTCVQGSPDSCGNFLCADASTCKTACDSDADCVSGYTCDKDRRCGPAAYCNSEHISTNADGVPTDCTPYVCDTSGMCKTKCVNYLDCTERSLCDGGQCVQRIGQAALGCSCRTASRRADPLALLLGLLMVSAGIVRRRTRLHKIS